MKIKSLENLMIHDNDDESVILEKMQTYSKIFKSGRYHVAIKGTLALAATAYCATIAGPETTASRLAIHGIVLGALIASRKFRKFITYGIRKKQLDKMIGDFKNELGTSENIIDDRQY